MLAWFTRKARSPCLDHEGHPCHSWDLLCCLISTALPCRVEDLRKLSPIEGSVSPSNKSLQFKTSEASEISLRKSPSSAPKEKSPWKFSSRSSRQPSKARPPTPCSPSSSFDSNYLLEYEWMRDVTMEMLHPDTPGLSCFVSSPEPPSEDGSSSTSSQMRSSIFEGTRPSSSLFSQDMMSSDGSSWIEVKHRWGFYALIHPWCCVVSQVACLALSLIILIHFGFWTCCACSIHWLLPLETLISWKSFACLLKHPENQYQKNQFMQWYLTINSWIVAQMFSFFF